MIELTGDPQVDNGIINHSYRRGRWYSIIRDLESLAIHMEDHPVVNDQERAMIEEVKSLIAKIN
jgi:hypothetical protein